MISPEYIAELRALADAATPGPWVCDNAWDHVPLVRSHGGDICLMIARSGKFIAASRTAIPELLDAIEARDKENAELRAEVERLRACVEKMDWFYDACNGKLRAEVERLSHSVEVRDAYAEKLRGDIERLQDRLDELEPVAEVEATEATQGINVEAWAADVKAKVAQMPITKMKPHFPEGILREFEEHERERREEEEAIRADERKRIAHHIDMRAGDGGTDLHTCMLLSHEIRSGKASEGE